MSSFKHMVTFPYIFYTFLVQVFLIIFVTIGQPAHHAHQTKNVENIAGDAVGTQAFYCSYGNENLTGAIERRHHIGGG